MALSSDTMHLLAQLPPKLRSETIRTIDVQYIAMNTGYADQEIGIVLASNRPELRAIGALLRHAFFGQAGQVPDSRMLWRALRAEIGLPLASTWPETRDFGPPPTEARSPRIGSPRREMHF